LISQVLLPPGICLFLERTGQLQASGVWTAILVGHTTRCLLSVLRFQQGKWRHIKV
jgi:Na+-driven multidrug efflux pump